MVKLSNALVQHVATPLLTLTSVSSPAAQDLSIERLFATSSLLMESNPNCQSGSITISKTLHESLENNERALESVSVVMQHVVHWYANAASPPEPHKDALFNLGHLFHDGQLLESNAELSLAYFIKAAEAGASCSIY
jgi:TPR repeat protein